MTDVQRLDRFGERLGRLGVVLHRRETLPVGERFRRVHIGGRERGLGHDISGHGRRGRRRLRRRRHRARAGQDATTTRAKVGESACCGLLWLSALCGER